MLGPKNFFSQKKFLFKKICLIKYNNPSRSQEPSLVCPAVGESQKKLMATRQPLEWVKAIKLVHLSKKGLATSYNSEPLRILRHPSGWCWTVSYLKDRSDICPVAAESQKRLMASRQPLEWVKATKLVQLSKIGIATSKSESIQLRTSKVLQASQWMLLTSIISEDKSDICPAAAESQKRLMATRQPLEWVKAIKLVQLSKKGLTTSKYESIQLRTIMALQASQWMMLWAVSYLKTD